MQNVHALGCPDLHRATGGSEFREIQAFIVQRGGGSFGKNDRSVAPPDALARPEACREFGGRRADAHHCTDPNKFASNQNGYGNPYYGS